LSHENAHLQAWRRRNPEQETTMGLRRRGEDYSQKNSRTPTEAARGSTGRSRRVTTTHASRGAGRPRLILLSNGGIAAFPPEGERELDLKVDITSFGSSGGSDHVLEGLRPNHAEIRRDELDEFRIYDLSGGGTAVDGWIARGTPLHTGDRVAMGAWTLCFYREEFADHGRPYGGRQGGEFAYDMPQPSRPIDRDAPVKVQTGPGGSHLSS
jgi:hypothetical protein